MANPKSTINKNVQNAADAVKGAAGKAVEKGQEAAKATGKAIKNVGEKVKKAGS